MAEYFVGDPNIVQVRQPEGSELCFAALGAAVSGVVLGDVDQALQTAFLSEEDGSFSPPPESRTEVPLSGSGKTLVIEVVQGYDQEASDVAGVVRNIDAWLRRGTTVALLHKKTRDPEDNSMHWVLLSGYTTTPDTDIPVLDVVSQVEIIDPLRDEKYLAHPLKVIDMIDRSMNANGVFAYAMSVESPVAD